MMGEEKITINSIDMEPQIEGPETLLDQIRTMVRQNKLAALAAVAIAVIALAAIFAPLAAPHDPCTQALTDRPQTPSAARVLGAGELGRGVFSRIIYGARVSLMVGLVPTVILMVIGTILGLLTRFYSGKIGLVIMRLADVTLAFPSLLLAMVIIYTIGGGLVSIFMALILVGWVGIARAVRSQTLPLREMEYMEAARSIGIEKWRIMFRHVLPNYLPFLIVLFTLNIPAAILTKSSLSFLGAKPQPSFVSWGLAVIRGKKHLFSEPWLPIALSVVITIVVMTFNFLGDGLRDMLDPYLKEQ